MSLTLNGFRARHAAALDAVDAALGDNYRQQKKGAEQVVFHFLLSNDSLFVHT
jgi:hypothetical protein